MDAAAQDEGGRVIPTTAVAVFIDHINTGQTHKAAPNGYGVGIRILVDRLNAVVDQLDGQSAEVHIVGDGALAILPGELSGADAVRIGGDLLAYCEANGYRSGNGGFAIAIAKGDVFLDRTAPSAVTAGGLPHYFGTPIDAAAHLIANAAPGQMIVDTRGFGTAEPWDLASGRNDYCGPQDLNGMQGVLQLYSPQPKDTFTPREERRGSIRRDVRTRAKIAQDVVDDWLTGKMELTLGSVETLRLQETLWDLWSVGNAPSEGLAPLAAFLSPERRVTLRKHLEGKPIVEVADLEELPEAAVIRSAADLVLDSFPKLIERYRSYRTDLLAPGPPNVSWESLLRDGLFPLVKAIEKLGEAPA